MRNKVCDESWTFRECIRVRLTCVSLYVIGTARPTCFMWNCGWWDKCFQTIYEMWLSVYASGAIEYHQPQSIITGCLFSKCLNWIFLLTHYTNNRHTSRASRILYCDERWTSECAICKLKGNHQSDSYSHHNSYGISTNTIRSISPHIRLSQSHNQTAPIDTNGYRPSCVCPAARMKS